MSAPPARVAVFASGGGTNLQALLDHEATADARYRVVLVVCNRPAGALDRARAAGVPGLVIATKGRPAADVARETLAALADRDVDVIALAGYLRLLPPEVVDRYRGRIVNIHPALLPDFGGKGMYGMNVHRAVVEAGVPRTGATVHLVDERYDEGAILAQWEVPVHPGDDADRVAERVLAVEHELYPRALDHLAEALARGRAAEPMPKIRAENPPRRVEERR